MTCSKQKRKAGRGKINKCQATFDQRARLGSRISLIIWIATLYDGVQPLHPQNADSPISRPPASVVLHDVTSALKRLREEKCHEPETSLGCIVSLRSC